MSNLLKNLLFALIIAAVIWFGYVFFIQDDGTSSGTVVSGEASQASLEAQEFLVRLNQLNTVNFDTSVFSDQRFVSMVNFRRDLIPEPVGRTNPFAPVE